MQITSTGYPLKFIQTHPSSNQHEKRYVFKFFSEKNKLHYIVCADYHENEFFAIKFYAKKDRRSSRKYNKIINRGDVSNILTTCTKVIPLLLQKFPNASFGFIGARTIDTKTNKVEGAIANQRYRIYQYHIPQLIGDRTFIHKSYENASAYMLLNKNHQNPDDIEDSIKSNIVQTYPDLLNVQF